MLRIILHIIVTAMLTGKAIFWNVANAGYSRSMRQTFAYLFTSPSVEAPIPQQTQLFTINETSYMLNQIVYNYYNINNISTSEFSYGKVIKSDNGKKSVRSCDPSFDQAPITATTHYWSGLSNLHSYQNIIYSTNDFNFITSDPESYFKSLDSLTLTFDLCNIQSGNHDQSVGCNYWHLVVEYNFISQLYLEADINVSYEQDCSGNKSSKEESITILQVFLLFFSVFYALLTIKDCSRAVRLYFGIKKAHNLARSAYLSGHINTEEPRNIAVMYEWSEVPTGIKRSFQSYWPLFTLLALLLCISENFIALSVNDDRYISYQSSHKILLGLSIMLLWWTGVQFLVKFRRVYEIAITSQTAIPRICLFFAGFLPLYIAFIFLGISIFSSHMGIFSSFSQAVTILFSILNGDSILPILNLMTLRSYMAALFFGMVFIVFATYLMLNILIAIVEEAYFRSSKNGRHLESLMWRNLDNIIASGSKSASSQNAQLSAGQQGAAADAMDQQDDSDNDEFDNWMHNVFSTKPSFGAPIVDTNKLTISLAEETAESYILGKSHWEYSKLIDFLVEKISND